MKIHTTTDNESLSLEFRIVPLCKDNDLVFLKKVN